jgi:error-prone DNA polymerase
LPVDVNISEWNCTIESSDHILRLGLRHVRGLRAVAGQAVAAAKPFRDVDDLARRVPELSKAELEVLAGIGALANLQTAHRRDALWKAARAGRPTGRLLEEVPETAPSAPLLQMTIHERLAADYKGTSMTVGRHPLYHSRAELNELGVTPAGNLRNVPNGRRVLGRRKASYLSAWKTKPASSTLW